MKHKDTEFLHATTRVRALERLLINKERMERMLDAKTVEEVVKLLPEMGYAEVTPATMKQAILAMDAGRAATWHLLHSLSPVPELLDVFGIKYDYHNAKALIKGAARQIDATPLLTDAGRVPVAKLTTAVSQNELRDLPQTLRAAIEEARETLARTEDPRRADLVLDRACFVEMLATAQAAESAYLLGYVRILIDVANLRTMVRATRQNQNAQFLRSVLIPGGNVEESRLALSENGLCELFRSTVLEEAAAEGVRAMTGEIGFVRFEKLCDDAVCAYLQSAKMVPFGDAPVVAYLAAKESEITQIRIILAGKSEDLPPEEIRERLRVSYV